MANFIASASPTLNKSPNNTEKQIEMRHSFVNYSPVESKSIDGLDSTDTRVITTKSIDKLIPAEVEPCVASALSISPLSLNSENNRGINVGSKRSAEDRASFIETATASLKSSSALEQLPTIDSSIVISRDGSIQQHQQAHKRQRIKISAADDLHRACANPMLNEKRILELIEASPLAASTPSATKVTKKVFNSRTNMMEDKEIACPYMYPLNVAISNKASPKVLQALINAAPQIIGMWDGQNKETALHLLLRNCNSALELVDMLLLTTPNAASTVNGKHETPLHVACRCQASLNIIRHLLILYPEALTQVDGHQQTPLQAAQRSAFLDDAILDCLQAHEQKLQRYV